MSTSRDAADRELKEVEKKLSRDEAKIAREEKEIKRLRFSMRSVVALVLILAAIGGGIGIYLTVTGLSVYIENSDVEAPEIALSASTPGVLNDMLVKAGDSVSADEVVARVGDELIKAKLAGIITKADAAVGASYAAGAPVASMIDPSGLRVVGHIDENKGLDRIRVGQYATFTVDAFGSKTYTGIIDEISPQARSGDIVFSISDKRAEQVFDIKVRYDQNMYPELKDGMSARIWVQTQ